MIRYYTDIYFLQRTPQKLMFMTLNFGLHLKTMASYKLSTP